MHQPAALRKVRKSPFSVVPAQAGIRLGVEMSVFSKPWIPAFAGMTSFCGASLNAPLVRSA
jgi:hypothetical protein